jgi:hypothetical protein
MVQPQHFCSMALLLLLLVVLLQLLSALAGPKEGRGGVASPGKVHSTLWSAPRASPLPPHTASVPTPPSIARLVREPLHCLAYTHHNNVP